MGKALVIGTNATKAAQLRQLADRLRHYGVTPAFIDISLHTDRSLLASKDKIAAMGAAAQRGLAEALRHPDAQVAVAIGGGSGSDIALELMRGLPDALPKILATTMPGDPRGSVADKSIILVPTVADIAGDNAALRQVFDRVAAMTAGLCRVQPHNSVRKSVAVTALGATDGAVSRLVAALETQGREVTVLHANGFGGAALCQMIEAGRFEALIDLTPHELTRMMVWGDHVAMPDRFTVAGKAALPQIVLPGALNFIGCGPLAALSDAHRKRPHYAHSPSFTHVQLSAGEMRAVAGALAKALSAAKGPVHMIVPMGGFSSEDGNGGAIDSPELRRVFLESFRADVGSNVTLRVLDAHIADAQTEAEILRSLGTFFEEKERVG